jgi:hypothetical protein
MAWQDLRRVSTQTAETFASHPYASAFTSIERSIGSLTPDEMLRFTELVVFPEALKVHESAILRLWHASLSEIEARRLLRKLWDKGLIDLSQERMRLHDLVREYLRLTCDDLTALHRHLLNSFGYSLQHPSNFRNDQYLLRHLAYHLTECGHRDVAAKLLKNFTYLAAKINNNLIHWLWLEYESAAGEPNRPDYTWFVNTLLLILYDLQRADAARPRR